MLRRSTSLFVLSLCAALGGCAQGLASGPRVGTDAPLFESTTTDDRPVSLAAYEDKALVLYFFATWCGPCRATSPNVQALHERFGERNDAAVLAIHYDDRYGKWDSAQDYLDDHEYTFPAVPNGGAIVEEYGIKRVPALIIIGVDGKVVHRQWGMSKSDVGRFERRINDHIENPTE